jgi:ribonuclease P protein component
MISKSNRLSKKSFKEIFDKGFFYHSSYFIAKYSKAGDHFSCAVVVPKSVSKKAAYRNRIRRVWYSIISDFLAKHKTQGSFIFILKKGNLKILESYTIISPILEKFFKNI